jgi:hypothetical protein
LFGITLSLGINILYKYSKSFYLIGERQNIYINVSSIYISYFEIAVGCGCEESEFGCCPDKKTAAPAPNYEGCGCVASEFGCCPDGETPASGEKFEGCEDSPIFPGGKFDSLRETSEFIDFVTPKIRACNPRTEDHVAILLSNGSTILNTVDVLDFGMEDVKAITIVSKLRRNANRLASNHLAKVGKNLYILYPKCVFRVNNFDFCIIAACYLPKISGPCEGYYPIWYYDQSRKQCGQFVYGGCLGNNNKFQTREECENLCVLPDHASKYLYSCMRACIIASCCILECACTYRRV